MFVIDPSNFIIYVSFYSYKAQENKTDKPNDLVPYRVIKPLTDVVYITIAQEQEVKPVLQLGYNHISQFAKGPIFIGGTLAFLNRNDGSDLFRIFNNTSNNPQQFPVFNLEQYGLSEMSSTALKVIKVFDIKITSFNFEETTNNNMPIVVQRYLARNFTQQIIETQPSEEKPEWFPDKLKNYMAEGETLTAKLRKQAESLA